MKFNKYFYIVIAVLLASCSNVKFLKEGELLYTGSVVNILGDLLILFPQAPFDLNQ